MVIVYHGRVQQLHKELGEARPNLDRAYRDIFGAERVDKIDEVARRTLTGASFFDDYREINRKFGAGLEASTPNKFIMLTNEVRVEPGLRKIKTAPAFYLSDTGSENSSYGRNLPSYIHEFNHFIWYALQKVPLYLFSLIADEAFGEDGMRSGNTAAEWIAGLKTRLTGESGSLSKEVFVEKMLILTYLGVFTEHNEKSNRILDKMVLKYLGIDVDLEWRGKQRQYAAQSIGRTMFAQPVGGDLYFGLSDREVIEKTLDWQNSMDFRSQSPSMKDFLGILRDVKISRLPLTELERFA